MTGTTKKIGILSNCPAGQQSKSGLNDSRHLWLFTVERLKISINKTGHCEMIKKDDGNQYTTFCEKDANG